MPRSSRALAVAVLLLVGCSAETVPDDDVESASEQEVVAGSSDRYTCVTSTRSGCVEDVGIGKSLEDADECKEGVDYQVTTRDARPGSPLVLAIHGGRIELGTAEIGAFLSGALGWDHYTFVASPRSASCKEPRWMHVTSNRFNAAVAVDMAKRHPSAVSLHGYSEENPERPWARGSKTYICVGGLHANARATFIRAMNTPAIEVEGRTVVAFDASRASDATSDICGGLQGQGLTNIVNQPSKNGVQLELPALLRAELAGTSGRAANETFRARLKRALEDALR